MVHEVVNGIDEVYQLAADMGGAGYIFTGEHDADRDAQLGHHQPEHARIRTRAGVRKFFYSSSACIYPEYNQRDPENPRCRKIRLSSGPGQRIRLGETVQ